MGVNTYATPIYGDLFVNYFCKFVWFFPDFTMMDYYVLPCHSNMPYDVNSYSLAFRSLDIGLCCLSFYLLIYSFIYLFKKKIALLPVLDVTRDFYNHIFIILEESNSNRKPFMKHSGEKTCRTSISPLLNPLHSRRDPALSRSEGYGHLFS